MSAIGSGMLARESGVPIDTIRHYERIGLLCPAGRRRAAARLAELGRVENCPILNALAGEGR
jgi:hypothetical protein